MYLPQAFKTDDAALLKAFLQSHPLAFLVTLADGTPTVDHIPMHVTGEPGRLVLRGHVARANPIHRQVADGTTVLAVFRGHDHYISPNWYPSKAEAGKAVPTWNYAVAHVHGQLRWHHEAAELLEIVSTLTDVHERAQSHPWSVSDAPPDYIDTMLKAIVGFTITVTAIEGKFKASQNRTAADRAGVRDGLTADGVPAAVRHEVTRDPAG